MRRSPFGERGPRRGPDRPSTCQRARRGASSPWAALNDSPATPVVLRHLGALPMEPHVLLRELWQPILLSTVLCFFACFVLHLLLPLHKGDFTALPADGGVLAALTKA